MTDVEVYTTKGKDIFVIQFQNEDGQTWTDASEPTFRSQDAAVTHLNSLPATAYPYRVVRRRP